MARASGERRLVQSEALVSRGAAPLLVGSNLSRQGWRGSACLPCLPQLRGAAELLFCTPAPGEGKANKPPSPRDLALLAPSSWIPLRVSVEDPGVSNSRCALHVLASRLSSGGCTRDAHPIYQRGQTADLVMESLLPVRQPPIPLHLLAEATRFPAGSRRQSRRDTRVVLGIR